MSRRPFFSRRALWLVLVAGFLGGSTAVAQTPTNTWVGTASDNWSNATNWNPAAVPTSSTSTVLQFNASGSTGYTATKDAAIPDPFSLQALIFNSTSSNPITLADVGANGLAFSTTGPYIYQNNAGAVVINNNMTINNSSSGSDLSLGGYGSGTVTINGLISGGGGINLTNLGGATFVLSNGGNTFTAGNPNGLTSPFGTWAPFSTLMATATSGTPLGGNTLFFYDGTTAIAPATTSPPSDIMLGTAAGKNLQLFSGGTLLLNKGGNTSLTFTANAFAVTLSSNSSGTLVVAPASGIANLGLLSATTGTPVGEALVVTLAPTAINNMVQPTIVGQASATDTTGDFVTYYAPGTVVGTNTYSGLAQVPQANAGLGIQGYTTYSTPGGNFSSDTTGTEISSVTANTTANASPVIQALRVTNSTLTIASGQTVTIGGQIWNTPHQQAGLILNNSTIAGPGTLAIGGATAANNELDIYASSAGMSVISAQIVSTNPGGTTPTLVMLGPGNVELTNTNNQFTAGAVFSLYGTGALVIPAANPGVLGTGTRTFIMRGGAFGITGGNWAAANVSLNLVQGGGGFFVDSNSTLTLSSSVLGFLGATTGTGPLYKTGAGTLTFSTSINTGNTLTGLQVNQGTLLVTTAITGNSPTGPTQNLPTVVNSTGILAGTGSVPGVAVINGGGTIAPGVPGSPATIGTLTTGGATFEPTGTYQFKYNPTAVNPVAGSSNDTIQSSTGPLDLSGLNSTKQFNVNFVQDPIGTPSGLITSYTAGSFSGFVLPTGFSGTNLTSLFNFTGLGSTVTPTASEVGNNLVFTITPQNFWTWSSTPASGLWSNANNWVPANVPISGPNTQLTFGATSNGTMTDDIAGTFILNSLTFNAGSPVYSLAGNGLNFETNGTGTLPQIASNSANALTISAPVTLTNNLTITSKANVTLSGVVTGSGSLTFSSSAGTLALTNAANTYGGGTNVLSGTVQVAADGDLGTGNITGSSLGTISFTGSTTTTKSFAMNGGTVSIAAGQTLTLNGSQVSGGAFLDGAGTFATSAANGASFIDVTATPSVAVVSNSPADRFVKFTNSGAFSVAANVNTGGTSTTLNINNFTNEGLGSVTIGAASHINVANFQSYGTLTENPATVGGTLSTLITNVGTSALGFNGGSRTFIGTPQTATSGGQPTFVAGIDLEGKNLVIAGGLFVNNGYVSDYSSGTPGSIIVDYGSLYKGAGFTGVNIVTQNGGRVQAGNSPGFANNAALTIGPGGLGAFNWEINNATGVGGPTADVNNQVSGWSQERAIIINQGGGHFSTGNLTWTATSTAGNQFQMALFTLMNPSTVGQENYGPMANFNPAQPYDWSFLTYAGTYSGPTDSATLTADTLLDTSTFVNAVAPGSTFTIALEPNASGGGGTMDLLYTPVPEPGTLALVGLGGLALGWTARRRRAKAATAV